MSGSLNVKGKIASSPLPDLPFPDRVGPFDQLKIPVQLSIGVDQLLDDRAFEVLKDSLTEQLAQHLDVLRKKSRERLVP